MKRSRYGAATLGMLVAGWACAASAQAVRGDTGAAANLIARLTERLEFAFGQLPALGAHLAGLPQAIGARTGFLVAAIVVAGLLVEYVAHLLLARSRLKVFDTMTARTPLRAFFRASLRPAMPEGRIAPVGHITNFSRDWTVVKFNLAFANGTDVELPGKTAKKIGSEMMEEPQFKAILMQPLKMQGVVDIKDNPLIVRFEFMARPKNPSVVQRMAVRRLYEQLPKLGIRFATPNFPFAMPVTTTSVPAPAPPAVRAAAARAAE